MCRDRATDPEVVVECGRTRIAGQLAHRDASGCGNRHAPRQLAAGSWAHGPWWVQVASQNPQ
jgi:hypothetical protein